MRVAYVCADPGVPVFGHKGCSIHVQEFLRALLRLGAETRLYAARIDGQPDKALGTVTVRRLPPQPKGDAAIREQAAIAANAGLRGMIPFQYRPSVSVTFLLSTKAAKKLVDPFQLCPDYIMIIVSPGITRDPAPSPCCRTPVGRISLKIIQGDDND